MSTPLELRNNLKRFNEGINNVYGGPSIYGDQAGFNFGFRQPYVWVKQTDPDIIKYIKKFDSRTFPIGSTAQDVLRIGKMMVSGKGIAFLATQFLLQAQGAFNETNLYNPAEVLIATARPASLGLLQRPKRFLDTSGDALGAILSAFGIQASNNARPNGTVRNRDALPKNQTDGAKGLIRGRTAASGLKNLDKIWLNQKSEDSGFLSKMVSTFAPGLIVPNTNDNVKARADETAADKMLDDYQKSSVTSRLQPHIPSLPLTSPGYSKFEQKYSVKQTGATEDKSYSKEIENLDSNTSQATILSDKLNGDALLGRFFPRGNEVTDINEALIASLQKFGAKPNNGIIGNIKTYTKLISISSKTEKGKSAGTMDGSFEKAMSSDRQSLTNKGFPGYKEQDRINSYGVVQEGHTTLSRGADQIVFYFEDVVNNRFIPFRATIKGINDNMSPEWQDIRYMGRADKIFVYRGFSRELNFNFSVYANSINELLPMWKKLNYLIGLGKPSNYTNPSVEPSDGSLMGGFVIPPFIKIRIGDMYKNQPAILTSIGISVPDDASWETTWDKDYTYLNGAIKQMGMPAAQYPTRVEVQVNMSLLEKSRPNSNMYNFDDENKEKAFDLIVS